MQKDVAEEGGEREQKERGRRENNVKCPSSPLLSPLSPPLSLPPPSHRGATQVAYHPPGETAISDLVLCG